MDLKSRAGKLWLFAVGLAWLFFVGAAFVLGKKTAKPTVRTLSDLQSFVGGERTYFMNFDVKCANGKDLGRVQVDLDLKTGKLRVVRNDPGQEPSCMK